MNIPETVYCTLGFVCLAPFVLAGMGLLVVGGAWADRGKKNE